MRACVGHADLRRQGDPRVRNRPSRGLGLRERGLRRTAASAEDVDLPVAVQSGALEVVGAEVASGRVARRLLAEPVALPCPIDIEVRQKRGIAPEELVVLLLKTLLGHQVADVVRDAALDELHEKRIIEALPPLLDHVLRNGDALVVVRLRRLVLEGRRQVRRGLARIRQRVFRDLEDGLLVIGSDRRNHRAASEESRRPAPDNRNLDHFCLHIFLEP